MKIGGFKMTGLTENITLTNDLKKEFYTILKSETIRTLYQPIININDGAILGYEALSRGPEGSRLESPLKLLSIAEILNKTWDLEQLLRTKALERAILPLKSLLFLNVDPNIIHDDNFQQGFTKEFLSNMELSPASIVFELTERSAISDYDTFKSVLKHYTEQGYSIAIDDAGSGYSGLKTLYEVYPKYLKLDMDFVRNIDKDTFKQTIVKNLLAMTKTANIKTIAEGIESSEELRTLIRLGVEYGQGYFIQKPLEKIQPINDIVISVLSKENKLISQINSYHQEYHYIHHLMHPISSFSSDNKCIEIFDYFNEHNYAGGCICDNNCPIGTISLREINAAFSKQFGHFIYAQRPVALIMNTAPLIVDYYTPIHTVAKKALARSNKTLYDDIVVQKGSAYAGMVTIKNLLDYLVNEFDQRVRKLT